ncbi:MAG TPA: ribosomal protein bL36 [Rickettsiales bacterium]|nr:ribosomal protein bL36 [Rickettsiales bacterium]
MKIVGSIKNLKARHKGCKVVRRGKKIFVINKVNPRYKAKQGKK